MVLPAQKIVIVTDPNRHCHMLGFQRFFSAWTTFLYRSSAMERRAMHVANTPNI